MEPEGQPTEERPTDTRPDIHQVLGVGALVMSNPVTTIHEEVEILHLVRSQPMETESPTRPRQPESEPGSELGERNVRPRVGSEVTERYVNGDEEQPSTTTEVDALPGAAATAVQANLHTQISASNYLTVLPCETEPSG